MQLERMFRKDLSKLPSDEARLRFLTEETHNANPESCWGRFVINLCNKLAIEIMIFRLRKDQICG